MANFSIFGGWSMKRQTSTVNKKEQSKDPKSDYSSKNVETYCSPSVHFLRLPWPQRLNEKNKTTKGLNAKSRCGFFLINDLASFALLEAGI